MTDGVLLKEIQKVSCFLTEVKQKVFCFVRERKDSVHSFLALASTQPLLQQDSLSAVILEDFSSAILSAY